MKKRMKNRILYQDSEITIIALTQGQYCIYDTEEHEKLSEYKWHAIPKRNRCYAETSTTSTYNLHNTRMQRLILDSPDNKYIDHINHDGCDNRKSNLRLCTHAENSRNSRRFKKNKTGYRGIACITKSGSYRVTICYNYTTYYVGCFKNIIDAAMAYNEAAIKYHGEFATLNKIPEAGE